MADDRDNWDDEERDSVEAVLRDIRTRGVRVAFDAAMDICADKKSPAPARATALNAVFRAGGLYQMNDVADDKPLSELTAAELARRSEKARLRVEALERERAEAQKQTVFD